MKLYAAERVDRQIVEALRAAGFGVAYTMETNPALADDAVLGKAAAERRLLLTSDKDFGELVHRLRKASEGVTPIRLTGLSPDLNARLVEEGATSRSDSSAPCGSGSAGVDLHPEPGRAVVAQRQAHSVPDPSPHLRQRCLEPTCAVMS